MERIEGESLESAKQKASMHNIFPTQTVSDYAMGGAAGSAGGHKVGTAMSGSRNHTQDNGISLALNSDSTVANENATTTIPARMLPQSTKHVNNKQIRRFSAQPQTGRNNSNTVGLAYGDDANRSKGT